MNKTSFQFMNHSKFLPVLSSFSTYLKYATCIMTNYDRYISHKQTSNHSCLSTLYPRNIPTYPRPHLHMVNPHTVCCLLTHTSTQPICKFKLNTIRFLPMSFPIHHSLLVPHVLMSSLLYKIILVHKFFLHQYTFNPDL